MRKIRALLLRLGGLFRKGRRHHDLAEEIESHLQLHIEDNLRAGMIPEEARRQALLHFGGVAAIQEEYRDRGSLPFLESLLQDLRYAGRTLRKNPGFTTVAALTLSLGIGGCAAMYALIHQLILLEHPYPDLDSLVIVQAVDSQYPQATRGLPGETFADIRSQGGSFEDIGGYTTDGFVLMSNNELPILDGALITPNIIEILGVKPLLGRTFQEDEGRPGSDNVVLLSERAWTRYFAGRAEIVGSTIELSRKLYTVIGIMPDGFWRDRDVWIPLGRPPSEVGRLRTWARLKQPASYTKAQAELDVLSARLAQGNPETERVWRMTVQNAFEIPTGQLAKLGAILVAPVGLVFLIACLNIAHLQLGRDVQRLREMALRRALGASRLRLMRQLLTESLLLAFMGGALGTMVASWGVDAMTAYLPARLVEPIGRLKVDQSALLFLLLLSASSSMLFGLLPAVRTSGLSLAAALKQGARHHTSKTSSRNLLIISEIAFSMMLLAGAGMVLVLFQHLTHTDLGFDARNLWSARLSLRGPGLADQASRRSWTASTLEQVQALPGVVSASVASELPLLGGNRRRVAAEGQSFSAATAPQVQYWAVSPSFFETLRIPLRQGRTFTEGDSEGANPVVIVNQTLAGQFFPEGALGKRLGVLRSGEGATELREVVGVVADIRQRPVDALAAPPIAYVPHRQESIGPLSLVVRTQGPPDAVGRAILDRINAPSPEVFLQSTFVFERTIRNWVRAEQFAPFSMALFAVLGLFLAAVGLYGTTSRGVAQRTQEFGIRQALGARATDVFRLVMRQSARCGVIGLALGAAGSFAVVTLLLKALDPQERSAFGADLLSTSEVLLAGLGAATLLMAVVLVATYLPARRATKVDPMTALRHE